MLYLYSTVLMPENWTKDQDFSWGWLALDFTHVFLGVFEVYI